MIITLRNIACMEMDLDWSEARGDDPPVMIHYDGRLFWRQPGLPAIYNETRVDDLSRHTVLARRHPEGFDGRADISDTPALPVDDLLSTDQDELMEID